MIIIKKEQANQAVNPNQGTRQVARQYSDLNLQTEVENASPHRLIQMLFEGALRRIAEAKGAMQRQDIATKGTAINKAVGIIGGLQEALNPEAAPNAKELADNLNNLYDYAVRRLTEAHVQNSVEMLDEVAQLLSTVKSGWDEIAPQA
ncbi:flagellar protein FliS [Allopseudospirillum japonicum]|uniref:Flagellar secretion chaperone FliS n=1 Tax=Allopseudospirillum japonicum TaxID=64971 RepID=A0A1H6TJE4_9GAMM|nr:flagellar export chaperone FliS [Allopseudospirillum japonicum]SEI78304.1 flagellar protein FliS [Allopseudospirillum japonicum]